MQSSLSTPPPEESLDFSCFLNPHDSNTFQQQQFDLNSCQFNQVPPSVSEPIASPHEIEDAFSSSETSPLPYLENQDFSLLHSAFTLPVDDSLTSSVDNSSNLMYFDFSTHTGIPSIMDTPVAANSADTESYYPTVVESRLNHHLKSQIPPTVQTEYTTNSPSFPASSSQHSSIPIISPKTFSFSPTEIIRDSKKDEESNASKGGLYGFDKTTAPHIRQAAEVLPVDNRNTMAGAGAGNPVTGGPSTTNKISSKDSFVVSHLGQQSNNNNTPTLNGSRSNVPKGSGEMRSYTLSTKRKKRSDQQQYLQDESLEKDNQTKSETLASSTTPYTKKETTTSSRKRVKKETSPKVEEKPTISHTNTSSGNEDNNNNNNNSSLPTSISTSPESPLSKTSLNNTIKTPSPKEKTTATATSSSIPVTPEQPQQQQQNKPKRKRATRRRLTPHQKIAHNKIEKKYRTNINEKIFGLQNLMPLSYETEHQDIDNLSSDVLEQLIMEEDEMMRTNGGLSKHVPESRPNKSSILERAASYIMFLKRTNHQLRCENRKLSS